MTPGCKNIDDCGTHIAFLAFGPATACGASLGIPKHGSWYCTAGEKNGLRPLWAGAPHLLRPQGAAGSGSVLWGHAHLPGRGDSPRPLPGLRDGKAGAPGVAGRQPVLHPTLPLCRGPAVPRLDSPGRGPGIPPELENRQGSGEAVHAGAAPAGRNSGAEGHRHRRGLHPQGAYLPHRGERPGAAPADLVRGPGPVRREHGPLFPGAGPAEEPEDSPGGDGHVEGLPERQRPARAAGEHPVRQVPYPAPSWKGLGPSAQERVRPSHGPGSPVYQGPEVYVALAPRKPHARRPAGVADLAAGQQAPEYSVPAQGVVRPALGLPEGGLGETVLRELACRPEVATPRAVREVRRHDRAALGWECGLLPARQQGGPRLRGRREQQDPRDPTTCLRVARRGVSASQGSYVYASRTLEMPKITHSFGRRAGNIDLSLKS